jgi:hypothetical protein
VVGCCECGDEPSGSSATKLGLILREDETLYRDK